MEIATRLKVLVTAQVENLRDLYNAEQGTLPVEQVRRIEVGDALVDAGATMLSLPKRLIDQLGLRRTRTRPVRTTAGTVHADLYEAVRLTVQGRDCVTEVLEVPEDCPPLIGQIPLEGLDFVIDPLGRKLVGNPEHGGEHMVEIL